MVRLHSTHSRLYLRPLVLALRPSVSSMWATVTRAARHRGLKLSDGGGGVVAGADGRGDHQTAGMDPREQLSRLPTARRLCIANAVDYTHHRRKTNGDDSASIECTTARLEFEQSGIELQSRHDLAH
ncbi:hypothetical protein OH77DRAFT_267930 [Trametes cingulata]|nr:hypothetical protein OH77DRAFT_267930 [Trametes cingulata]